jgi:hypothetical protein
MSDFRQRVIEEQKELQDKINKLEFLINDSNNFFDVVESTMERLRLVDQLTYMRKYNRVLKERIEKDFK